MCACAKDDTELSALPNVVVCIVRRFYKLSPRQTANFAEK